MSTLLYFGMAEKNCACGSFLPHFICFRHHIAGSRESLDGAKALPATHMVQKDGNSCIYLRLSTQFSKPLNGA